MDARSAFDEVLPVAVFKLVLSSFKFSASSRVTPFCCHKEKILIVVLAYDKLQHFEFTLQRAAYSWVRDVVEIDDTEKFDPNGHLHGETFGDLQDDISIRALRIVEAWGIQEGDRSPTNSGFIRLGNLSIFEVYSELGGVLVGAWSPLYPLVLVVAGLLTGQNPNRFFLPLHVRILKTLTSVLCED